MLSWGGLGGRSPPQETVGGSGGAKPPSGISVTRALPPCLAPNFFSSEFLFDQKNFGRKQFRPKIFRPKIFRPKIFRPKIFSSEFFSSNFFSSKFFSSVVGPSSIRRPSSKIQKRRRITTPYIPSSYLLPFLKILCHITPFIRSDLTFRLDLTSPIFDIT